MAFLAPLKVRDNRGDSVGDVVLSQTALIGFDATLVQQATFKLPANAQITAIHRDIVTTFNSATSAGLTVGSAAAGTQYAGSDDLKTAAARNSAITKAQAANLGDIGANTTVYATVTSVGQPTAGSVRVTIQYVATAAS